MLLTMLDYGPSVSGRAVILAVALPLLLVGCVGFTPRPPATVSLGGASEGVLLRGKPIADQGLGYVRARPGESTRFGTPELLAALERAAASVAEHFPGSAPLRIGDLSSPSGGRHSRHGSHRSGRDVDTIFYVLDAEGRSVRGRGWLGFDRFGVARETGGPNATNELFFFDDARNWHFVRTLLLDPEASVQWIFCSTGVKARLLRYAAAHEPLPEVIFRAAWVLHEPSAGNRHDDHFHIRIACTAEQASLGCQDRAPIWPWIRKRVEKPAGETGPALTDALLVHALLSEDGAEDSGPLLAEN